MSKSMSRKDFLKGTAVGAMGIAAMSLVGCGTTTATPTEEAVTSEQTAPPVETVAPVEEAITPDEVLDCDVAVLGLGVAGMIAASRAAQFGAKVIGIDPAISPAGTNACGIYGSFSLEDREELKQDNYVTKEEYFKYVYEGTFYQTNAALLTNMCDALGPAFNMMFDGGVTFTLDFLNATPEDSIAKRTGHFFEKSGSERAEQIQGMLDKFGANCMWGTRATSLITDSSGAVVGVYAKGSDGKVYQINAKGGVIVCCGGFVHNADMINEYFRGCEIVSISNTFDDGSGLKMAMDAGCQMGKNFSVSMYEFSASNPKDPKMGWFTANSIMFSERIGHLFVNKRGDRFMNEQWMVTRTMFCSEPLIREGGKYYMVYDTALLKELSTHSMLEMTGDGVLNANDDVGGQMVAAMTLNDILEEAEAAIEEGFCWKADTIEELADAVGMVNLAETVTKYNEYVDNGADPQMYKDAAFLRPIKEGPFYAVECVLNCWVTLGGLKTDGDCRALNSSSDAIPGLYVAGADCDAWSVPYYALTSTSGFSFATGYIAAESAANRALEV